VVSAASAREIAITQAAGQLEAPDDLEAQLERHRFLPLPIAIGHALHAGGLPPHHETARPARTAAPGNKTWRKHAHDCQDG
jgi:PIN domain nuclease of toxin-antitoxin system